MFLVQYLVLWEPSKELGMFSVGEELQVEMVTPLQTELVSWSSLTTLAVSYQESRQLKVGFAAHVS